MKLTKSHIKQLIKEELQNILILEDADFGGGAPVWLDKCPDHLVDTPWCCPDAPEWTAPADLPDDWECPTELTRAAHETY